jgi:hypothetical protein
MTGRHTWTNNSRRSHSCRGCARWRRRSPIKDWSLTSLKEKLIKIGERRQLWLLRCIRDGRGRHSEKPLRRHPAIDRGTATAGRRFDRVRRSIVMDLGQTHGGRRPYDKKIAIFERGMGPIQTPVCLSPITTGPACQGSRWEPRLGSGRPHLGNARLGGIHGPS